MNALIVGRTIEDLKECQRYNLPQHEPAPSCHLGIDYENFDGDVITCHTVKFGAVATCSAEASKRVLDSARQHPGKVNLAFCMNHHEGQIPEDVRHNMVYWEPNYHDYPAFNSGIFALWYALYKGYTHVYTCGLDGNRIIFKHGKYDYQKACAYVRKREHFYFDDPDIEEPTVSCKRATQLIGAIEQLKKEFPNTKIYKASSLSQAPLDVKLPPMRVNSSSWRPINE